MDKYLSDKIKVLSFISILCVLFIHATSIQFNTPSDKSVINNGYSFFIQLFITSGIARVGVPYFFLISGFLFFVNVNKFNFELYKQKVISRIHSVLIPYLFWSIYSFLFVLVLQSFPYFKSFFMSELIINFSFSKVLYKIFVFPFAYQLWFLRDLFVIILFSYFIFLSRKIYLLVTVLLLTYWFFSPKLFFTTIDSVLFFYIGSIFGIKKNILKVNYNYLILYISSFFWFILLFVKTLIRYYKIETDWYFILHNLSILVGVVFIWIIYDFVMKKDSFYFKKIISLNKYIFFVYVFHEPIMTIFKKALFFFFGVSEFNSIIVYFLSPISVFSICVLCYTFFKLYFPSIFKLSQGGR